MIARAPARPSACSAGRRRPASPASSAPCSLAMIEPAEGYCGGRFDGVRAQVAGQHPVGGGEVVAVVVVHRADDRHLVHQPGVLGQQLGDLHAGHGRRDRLERPAKLGRSVGLGVVGLVLRRPAVEPDQDHRSVARPALAGRPSPQRRARSRLASVSPVAPRHPTFKKPRRLSPSQRRRRIRSARASRSLLARIATTTDRLTD